MEPSILDLLEAQNRVIEKIERDQGKALDRIEAHLSKLNGRVGDLENRVTSVEAVMDNMNERIDFNADRVDKCHSWMEQQKGWTGGRGHLVLQVSILIGVVGSAIALLVSLSKVMTALATIPK